MIGKSGFRDLLESGCNGDRRQFGRRVCHLLGVTDANGRYHFNKHGERQLRDPDANTKRIALDEFSLRGLAEATLGEDWPKKLPAVGQYLQQRELLEAIGANEQWERSLLEDTGAGTASASAFANINAFAAPTAGLLDAMILEAYENPEFIGDVLAPVEPSKIIEGRKTIGVSRIGDKAEERLPLMPTARVQVGERWLTQPRTVENALAAEVDYLAVFLDKTGGQLAEHTGAAGVGEWLGYRKELRTIDSFLGIVQSYNYKGTSYNSYIAAGYYDNYISSGNELLHEDNVQAMMIKFRDMTDPDTSTRILVNPNAILVNREKLRTADAIFGANAQAYQLRDAPGATTGTQQINVSTPYYKKNNFRVLESPLVYQRMTDANGLNLSASNAGKVTIMFESGPKTHVYVQNWPMRTRSAAPNNVDMIDRDVFMFTKADERGVPWWKEPRRAVQSRA